MIPVRLLEPGDIVSTDDGEAMILGFHYINNGEENIRDSVDVMMLETDEIKVEYLFSSVKSILRKRDEQGGEGTVLDTLL